VVGGKLRKRMRATTHRVLEIARAARSRAGERLEQGYRRLLSTVRSTVRDAERVRAELAAGTRAALSQHMLVVTRSQAQLEQFVPLVRRVVAQTRARIFQNDTHYPDKLFSLFEPHTEALRKGKASTPTEFGKLLRVQEAEHQMVVDYQVYDRGPEDRTLLLPTIEAHLRAFGRAPHLLAGFWSTANKRAATERGSKKCAFLRSAD